MFNIILSDNQSISLLGWLHLIETENIAAQTALAENRRELLASLQQKPDALVILDYTLFDFASADELVIFQLRFPKSRWLLFSAELSCEFLKTVLYKSQSFSILFKDSSLDEISICLKQILKQSRYICSAASNLLLDSQKSAKTHSRNRLLTASEQEILREIALGLSSKQIAEKRNVSAYTVMTHRKNIFRKLEVNNAHEAVKYAMRAGIVDVAEYYI